MAIKTRETTATGVTNKGSPLTNAELDNNFVELVANKVDLTDLSVTTNSAGTAALSYNNSSGVFTYTPPDLSGYLTSFTETNDLTASVTWANVPNANITQASVTQHQAALAVTASQISDLTATAAELNLVDGSAADTVVNSKAVVYGSAGQITANELDVDNIQIDANAVKSTNTNGNIQLFPNGTGYTELYGNTNPGAIRFNCENNSHGVTVKGPAHSASATYTLELPDADGSSGQFLKTDGSGKLSFTSSLPGITASASEINTLDGITATTAELNILDGVTATAAELNALDGITATVAELNLLDGVTATTAELNYVDGVTSAIQTQLDAKQASDAQLTDIAGLTPTDGNFIVGDGSNFVTESGSTARTSLGVSIGSDVQAYDSNLTSFVGTFTLPTSDGSADQVLKTNGSGTLSFADAAGGGDITEAAHRIYNNTTTVGNESVVLAIGTNLSGSNETMTAMGYNCLTNTGTSCDNSLVMGYQAGRYLNGNQAVLLGHSAAANAVITGSRNICIGDRAGNDITSGANNICIGEEAAGDMSSGSASGDKNIMIGALTDHGGDLNVVIGQQAGANSSQGYGGDGNTYVGSYAGDMGNDSANYCIAIGYQARTSSSAHTNKYVIGYNFAGRDDSETISIGNNSAYIWNDFGSNSSWSRTSDERLKKDFNDCDLGLAFINDLQPVTYRWKPVSEVDPSLLTEGQTDRKNLDTHYVGLKAQAVKASVEKHGAHGYGIVSECSETGTLGMSYEQLITPLVQAVKDLSAKVERLEAEIEELRA